MCTEAASSRQVGVFRRGVPTPIGALSRISRMTADFLVRFSRICHKDHRVIVDRDTHLWNTQRVNEMMALCESILTLA
jgi:hypothetical protein